ncbi:MAG TPA: CdaR family protein [Methylomirabilota bacterium]|nr:CdaR family protein [Methylomirabilota bacterium]
MAAQVSVLVQHWELKLLALGVSMVLWLFVMTSEKADLIMAAPLELDNIPAGLEVRGDRPDSVDVQLHGLRGALTRLGTDRVKARLNLAGAKAGEVTVRVLPEQITVPPGITVVRVNPSRVRLVLESVRS